MAHDITYRSKSTTRIYVFRKGKRIGTIRLRNGEWRFYRFSRHASETAFSSSHPTLIECKAALAAPYALARALETA